jgi:hypothetical protein
VKLCAINSSQQIILTIENLQAIFARGAYIPPLAVCQEIHQVVLVFHPKKNGSAPAASLCFSKICRTSPY